MFCKKCGTEVKEGTKFCAECGTPVVQQVVEEPVVQEEEKVCSNCGAQLQEGKKFCSECGAPVTQQMEKEKICSNCGAQLQEGKKFCSECGTPAVQEAQKICLNCGAELKAGEKFCSECGTNIDSVKIGNNINDSPIKNYGATNKKPTTNKKKILIIASCVLFIYSAYLLFSNLSSKPVQENPVATQLLFKALEENADADLIKELIKKGANVNSLDNESEFPPALYALCYDNMEAFEILLKAGADPNLYIDAESLSLFCLIVSNDFRLPNRLNIIKLMIKYGADVKKGFTTWERQPSPLMLLVSSFNDHLAGEDENPAIQIEMVELLIKAGANINEKDSYGKSVLWYAQEFSTKEIIDYLIYAGAVED